ncbi:hypothetical protein JQN58_19105 [Aneurinibacillus sp. BA2021]|nr:hypothetical protein [Aneurinibacillus sp. BA2021]
MNLDQYVGQTVTVRYASPSGEQCSTGYVLSSNERMALTLQCEDDVLVIACYRILSVDVEKG